MDDHRAARHRELLGLAGVPLAPGANPARGAGQAPPLHLRMHPPGGTGTAVPDETTWVRRAKAGDQAAFTAIVEHYQGRISRFIYYLMGNADDTTELTQECFLRAYRALAQTSDSVALAAWLRRIAANACLDVLRRRQRYRWLPWEARKHDHLLPASVSDDPEREVLRQETQTQVARVLQQLRPRNRLALVLREVDGLSCAEIGEIMGLSRGAVKSVLFRAREEFREYYWAIEEQRKR